MRRRVDGVSRGLAEDEVARLQNAGSSDGPSGARLAATIRPSPRRDAMNASAHGRLPNAPRGGEVPVVGDAAAAAERDGRVGAAWTGPDAQAAIPNRGDGGAAIAGILCRPRRGACS
jgi:hypothetical protein